MNRRLIPQFARFSVAGGIGFLIEAVILTWLVQGQDMNIYGARLISFSVAVTATWAINRNFAFAGHKSAARGREYSTYFVLQIVGAVINFVVYVSAIAARPGLREMIVVPLAMGSAVGMFFNFFAARLWVFRGDLSGPPLPPRGRGR